MMRSRRHAFAILMAFVFLFGVGGVFAFGIGTLTFAGEVNVDTRLGVRIAGGDRISYQNVAGFIWLESGRPYDTRDSWRNLASAPPTSGYSQFISAGQSVTFSNAGYSMVSFQIHNYGTVPAILDHVDTRMTAATGGIYPFNNALDMGFMI